MDTYGAGDSFAAGLTFALGSGLERARCGRVRGPLRRRGAHRDAASRRQCTLVACARLAAARRPASSGGGAAHLSSRLGCASPSAERHAGDGVAKWGKVA